MPRGSSTSWGRQQKLKNSLVLAGQAQKPRPCSSGKTSIGFQQGQDLCKMWPVTSAGWLCCCSDFGDLRTAGVSPQPSRRQVWNPSKAAGMNSNSDTTLKQRCPVLHFSHMGDVCRNVDPVVSYLPAPGHVSSYKLSSFGSQTPLAPSEAMAQRHLWGVTKFPETQRWPSVK